MEIEDGLTKIGGILGISGHRGAGAAGWLTPCGVQKQRPDLCRN
jgi:hypothetical protein